MNSFFEQHILLFNCIFLFNFPCHLIAGPEIPLINLHIMPDVDITPLKEPITW